MAGTDSSAIKLRETLALSLREIERLRQRLAQGQGTDREPIAIVGMGLRLPGGIVDLASLWHVLENGLDVVGPIPASRWNADRTYDPDPDARGKSYVREGGFVSDIDLFDPAFFGISPREARHIDPQHRLLLEAAWEAFEDAGIVPHALKQSRTGIFVGIGPSDYEAMQQSNIDADAYKVLGTHSAFAAGRLAFTFGLQGPALSVDTACSSSLVALHLACLSLRRGECTLALAAGVQVMAAPQLFVLLSRTRALAADGRSRTFSANASGYGRGEGVVVLVLERLSDARARGRNILAVVRGSAVNHDGASSSITAPNGISQQAVLRAALDDAQLTPADVDMVECHGTGTSLGDPIEVQALAAVYGQGRRADDPLLLGALKSNVGHLESASGLAGVAKIIAAMRYGALPPSLHCAPRSPQIDWDTLPVRVVDRLMRWEGNAHPRRAGVSAFGLSGTNAHAILEEPPRGQAARETTATEASAKHWPFVLSARTLPALQDHARQLLGRLETQPDISFADLAFSLATSRSAFEQRAAIIASDRIELQSALTKLAQGSTSQCLQIADSNAHRGALVVLFSGQGSQFAGMGKALYREFPLYRAVFDSLCSRFDDTLNRPLGAVVMAEAGDSDAALLDQTGYTQPALFALEVALFRLLESWGLKPDFLMGHSLGEISAAHVAGILSIDDACTLVAARARLMQALPVRGAMVSLEANEQEVLAQLENVQQQVAIAALNGPRSTVISGDEAAVLAVAGHFTSIGRRTTRLAVSHAFHSAHMDDMLAAFRDVLSTLHFEEPQIDIISNVSGKLATKRELSTPDYWVKHVRGTVRFSDGVTALAKSGVTTFLEVGPQAVLCALVQQSLGDSRLPNSTFIATLKKDRPADATLMTALAGLHLRDYPMDWKAFFAPYAVQRIDLPHYPFQRQRYWIDAVNHEATQKSAPAGQYALAGERLDLPDKVIVHQLAIGPAHQAYLADHRVYGRIVVPGAFYLAILLAISESHWPGQAIDIHDVQFLRVLSFDDSHDEATLFVQLREIGNAQAGYAVTLSTRQGEDWIVHATAVIQPHGSARSALHEPFALPQEALRESTHIVDKLRAVEVDWGARWWWLRGSTRIDERRHIGRLGAPPDVPDNDAPLPGGLIDNTFAFALIDGPSDDDTPQLPFTIERVIWSGRKVPPVWVRHGMRDEPDARREYTVADLTLHDAENGWVASIEGVTTRRAPVERFLPDQACRDLYAVKWSDVAIGTTRRSVRPSVAVIGELPASLREKIAASANMDLYEDWAELNARSAQGRQFPDIVLACCVATQTAATDDAANDASLVTRAHNACGRMLSIVQGWLASADASASRLVVMTRHAISTDTAEDVADLEHAPLWGMLRSVQAEHPDRRISLLDVDNDASSHSRFVDVLDCGKAQIALRRGTLFEPSLMSAPAAQLSSRSSLDPNGTVVLTGGTGALGMLLAEHLVRKHQCRHLLLLSRQGQRAEGAEYWRRKLERAGATITIAACEVERRESLVEALSLIADDHPLIGVIHLAGVVDDGPVDALNAARLERVLKPKLDGAWHLHDLTRHLDLAFFVMYSSLAGVIGTAGQANYAAANSFLDALSQHRRAQGMRALSLAWGPWAQSGMAAKLNVADQARLRRRGIALLTPAEGFAAFDAALGRDDTLLVAARMRASGVRHSDAANSSLDSVHDANGPSSAARMNTPAPLRVQLANLPAAQREHAQLDFIRSVVADVLGLEGPETVDPERALRELGLDSLMALEIRNRLNRACELSLPATLLFECPTCVALRDRIRIASTPVESVSAPRRFETTVSLDALAAEVGRLESASPEHAFDTAELSAIARRLQAVVAARSESTTATTELQKVSNEELFGLLDQHFGNHHRIG